MSPTFFVPFILVEPHLAERCGGVAIDADLGHEFLAGPVGQVLGIVEWDCRGKRCRQGKQT
jgi:hypothetical protein